MRMTQYQQTLVTEHLDLPYTIAQCRVKSHSAIWPEYDDLCQEGNLALCNAAIHYNASLPATFRTYASCAIQNRITNYLQKRNKVPAISQNDFLTDQENIISCDILPDSSGPLLCDEVELTMFLNTIKSQYSGVTRKGIEALLLNVLGYDLQTISTIYKTTPNNISAWLSKAKKALRTNAQVKNLYS